MKKRGNGSGTAYKRGDTWTACVTVGFRVKDGTLRQKRRTKGGFPTKTAALKYCATLAVQERPEDISVASLYKRWSEQYSPRVKSMAGYIAAFKHLEPVSGMPIRKVRAEDWQACIDSCSAGKRTKEMIRTLAGLLTTFAMVNDYADRDYTKGLFCGKDKVGTHRALTMDEIEIVRQHLGEPFVDYIYCLIYTGFRPGELFALTPASYDPKQRTLIGGGKTKAGTDRTVPVASKILPIIEERAKRGEKFLFPAEKGGKMDVVWFNNSIFKPIMARLGIRDAVPYSCRHTFANLLKNVAGADTDKAALMGHTDISMTRYYQSEELSNLRRIVADL